jgi:hypothetical protein
MERKNSEVSG